MAQRKLDIFLSVNDDELRSKLIESTNILKRFSTTLGGILGVGAIGFPIKAMGDFALDASKRFEQAQISFSKMLQSEKDGQKLINDIQQLANVTPMTSDSLAQNAKLLLNFNAVGKDEVIPTLKMLGDITGGDKTRMDSLTLAFAQSASAGRLMGQDLLQMINAGFNPLQIISEKTGKSMAQLKDEMSKGKISTDMVKQAFKDATAEGGKFNGMMEAQSKSLAGLEATRADSLEIFARTISDVAMPALKGLDQAEIGLINRATEGTEKLRDFMSVNNVAINGLTNTALALVTVATGVTSLNAVVGMLSTAYINAVNAVKAEEAATTALAYAKQVLAAEEVGLYQATLANNAIRTAQTAKDLKQAQASYAVAAAKVTETTATANATKATALQVAMTGNLTGALRICITQLKAFVVALATTPMGLATVAITALTAGFFALKNSAESTKKAIEDLDNAQNKNVSTTTEAIQTLKELGGQKNLNYEQTKRLENAENTLKNNLGDLIKKYPNYIARLRQELNLKGQISRATAEQIAQELTLQKVKGLQTQRTKLNRDMQRDRLISWFNPFNNAFTDTKTTGGRQGVRKANQRRDDELKKQEKALQKEHESIVNSILGVNNAGGGSAGISTAGGGGASSSSSSDKSKKGKGSKSTKSDADKQRNNSIALNQAILDAQLLQVQKNSEDEYRLQLAKIDARIAAEKKGTAEYQQALNERTQLEQQHYQQVGEMQLSSYNNSVQIDNLKLDHEKEVLDKQKERGAVSNDEYYDKLRAFEDKKYAMELVGLSKQQEIYKNDLQKFTELEQQKALLFAQYSNNIQNLELERANAQYQNWRDTFDKVNSSLGDNLSNFISGNQTLKESYQNLFNEIYKAFANMIVKMLAEAVKLKAINLMKGVAGGGGKFAGLFQGIGAITGWFADGGIVPGNYSQPTPIVAHGSEMVLNPMQQRNLWNLIAGAGGNNNTVAGRPTGAGATADKSQPVVINQISPVFQSLDPAQGQRMFNDWMRQTGISLVRDSIKNNNYQMRDVVKNASG